MRHSAENIIKCKQSRFVSTTMQNTKYTTGTYCYSESRFSKVCCSEDCYSAWTRVGRFKSTDFFLSKKSSNLNHTYHHKSPDSVHSDFIYLLTYFHVFQFILRCKSRSNETLTAAYLLFALQEYNRK